METSTCSSVIASNSSTILFSIEKPRLFIRQRGFRGFHPQPDRLLQIFVDGHQQGVCVAVKNLRAECSSDLLGCRRCRRIWKPRSFTRLAASCCRT
jgi:hypothetical protein